jgi:hypothetical protein
MLLIGWGREGAKDVRSCRSEFPCDEGLDCVDTQGAQSEEVLQEIADWLENNPNAQFLYIGSHGDKTAVFPIGRPDAFTPKITWSKLASVLSKANRQITLWLGACLSAFAADHWRDETTLPVNPIVSFSGEPGTSEVKEFLTELVRMNSLLPSKSGEDHEDISFLPDDVVELLEAFPKIKIHYKVDGHGYVDCVNFSETTGLELQDYFDSICKKDDLAPFWKDVLHSLAALKQLNKESKVEEENQRSPCEELEVRKLKKVKRRRKTKK